MLVAFVGPVTSLLWQSPYLRRWLRGFRGRGGEGSGVDRWAHWLHKGAFGLMLVALGINVIPFNMQALGWWSVAITAASAFLTWAVPMVLPVILRSVSQSATSNAPWRTIDPRLPLTMMALAGFFIHAMADGASLYSFGDGIQQSWGFILILDRMAVGFFVWVLVGTLNIPQDLQPYQTYFAWLALVLLCVATALGYFMMQYVVQIVTDPLILGSIQSVLAGLVLQLVLGNRHGHSKSFQSAPQIPMTIAAK